MMMLTTGLAGRTLHNHREARRVPRSALEREPSRLGALLQAQQEDVLPMSPGSGIDAERLLPTEE